MSTYAAEVSRFLVGLSVWEQGEGLELDEIDVGLFVHFHDEVIPEEPFGLGRGGVVERAASGELEVLARGPDGASFRAVTEKKVSRKDPQQWAQRNPG